MEHIWVSLSIFTFGDNCSLTCVFFLQKSFQRDRKTGLTTLKYSVEKRTDVVINGAPCSIINVKLDCDVELTPWCDNPGS